MEGVNNRILNIEHKQIRSGIRKLGRPRTRWRDLVREDKGVGTDKQEKCSGKNRKE
jgi:hypothetical protein